MTHPKDLVRDSTVAQIADDPVNLKSHQSLARRSHRSVSIRDSLRQFPHFNLCSDIHLRELIETGYRKFYQTSDVVFHENELGDHFYLVLSGSVETVVTRLDRHVKVYKSGDIFGEVAVMLNLPYTCTACVLEDTNLFVIHKRSFDRLLQQHPKLAETFTQELTKETELYQGIRQQLQELGFLNATEHNHRFADWVQARLKGIFPAKAPGEDAKTQ